jgi:exosome complex protein LRP1
LADTRALSQAGNDKIDLARAEREAKEKAMAQLRAWQAARKKQPVAASTVPQKRPMEEEDDEAAPSDSGNGDGLDPADIAQNVEDMIREEANAGSQDSDRSPTKTPVTEDVQSRLLETPEEKERIIAAKRQRKRSRKENKKAKKQQILAARAAARAPAPNEAQGSSG